MAIRLEQEAEAHALASIKRFFAETLDEEIGELKASLVLTFVVRELGPSLYNRGVADAQAWLHEKVADLDGSCYEPEFGYWEKPGSG